jgi:N-acetylneuraminic acid mutarotase
MNKFFRFLSLTLVAASLAIFAGCDRDKDSESNQNDTTAEEWKQLTNFGGAKRCRATCFCLNGKIYVGHGEGRDPYDDFWEYNPVSDQWQRLGNCPKTNPLVYFSIGNKGYVVYYMQNNMSALWEYDAITNEWIQKTNLPDGLSTAYLFSFASNSKGYVGKSGSLWEYNPQNDTWTEKQSISIATCESRGVCINNKGYIFAGGISTGNGSSADVVWEYDIELNQWTPKSNLPMYIDDFVSFTINNKIYIGIGIISSYSSTYWDFNNTIYELNLDKNEWTRKTGLPAENRQGAIAAVLNNKVYIGLGKNAYGSSYNDFWQFTP